MREESVSAMFMDIAEIKDMMQSMQNALTDNEIDWEARRYEIAKSAMNTLLNNQEMVVAMLQSPNPKGFEYQVARKSVSFADALIDELKKKGE